MHNPLLDVAGDIGAAEFGFTPELRLAWVNDTAALNSLGLSMRVFGTGDVSA